MWCGKPSDCPYTHCLAVFYSPWFNWTKNALSDLGVQGVAAILFNSGLIVSGLLTVIFAIGLREVLLNRFLGRIGTLILMLDVATLCAIGVFPETTGALHFYVSVAFFTLLPISLFLIGAAMMRQSPERKLGTRIEREGIKEVAKRYHTSR